jgi:hypothetical protein
MWGGVQEEFARRLQQESLRRQVAATPASGAGGSQGTSATPAAAGQAAAAVNPPALAAGQAGRCTQPRTSRCKAVGPVATPSRAGRHQQPTTTSSRGVPHIAAAPGAPGGSGSDEKEDMGSPPKSPHPSPPTRQAARA